jgi:hypothetical protein
MCRCVLWPGVSYVPVRLMGRYVLWAGTSYGPVRLIARCVLWAVKYGECVCEVTEDTLEDKAVYYNMETEQLSVYYVPKERLLLVR